MSTTDLASEATKTSIENAVDWYLADKIQSAATPIAAKKYLTSDNVLVQLTRCNVAETAVPKVKVQVFERVSGGVREQGYQIFGDHRFTMYVNDMIFGTKPGMADGTQNPDVSESEGQKLLQLLGRLGEARQTL